MLGELQLVHEVEPAPEYSPYAHEKHDSLFAVAKVPAAHTIQSVPFQIEPLSHVVHELAPAAEYEGATHAVHEMSPELE